MAPKTWGSVRRWKFERLAQLRSWRFAAVSRELRPEPESTPAALASLGAVRPQPQPRRLRLHRPRQQLQPRSRPRNIFQRSTSGCDSGFAFSVARERRKPSIQFPRRFSALTHSSSSVGTVASASSRAAHRYRCTPGIASGGRRQVPSETGTRQFRQQVVGNLPTRSPLANKTVHYVIQLAGGTPVTQVVASARGEELEAGASVRPSPAPSPCLVPQQHGPSRQ